MDFSLTTILFISILLLIVSALYSSVGHGGASGYLAVLSFFTFTPNQLATTALTLNILVSGLSFFSYYRAGHFSFKLAFPFVIASIPTAFLGGTMHITNKAYYFLLSCVLIIAGIRMLLPLNKKSNKSLTSPGIPVTIITGGSIGILSGIVGIGGGIFLSPIMILMKWASTKKTSAIAAFFILVNSISGLCGRCFGGTIEFQSMLPFIVATFIGGLAGSYSGANFLSSISLRRILAIVLFIASVKLIIKMY